MQLQQSSKTSSPDGALAGFNESEGLRWMMPHCGDLLFIQVCSVAETRHCSIGQGNKASLLFCASLQNRLACLCHFKYTYGDLLVTQVCSDPTPKHCSSVQGKIASPLFSVSLQDRLTTGLLLLKLHQWRFALHTGVQ
jgi:hypothetical protein